MSTTNDDIVSRVIEDLKNKILTKGNLNGKVKQVYSEEHLADKTKGVSLPAVGIVYEGITPDGNGQGGSPSVVSCRLILTVVLITDNAEANGGIPLPKAHEYLSAFRTAINRTKSPTGHAYKFVVEAPAVQKEGRVMWVQRWSTALQI